MRILFLGDVVGRSGRDAIIEAVPGLRKELQLDLVVVNGENAAHGFGLTPKICKAFYEVGVDAITTGNHVWDNREILTHIGDDQRLLRPLNFPKGAPGRGWAIIETKTAGRALIANVMLRLFMDPLDCPFNAMDEVMNTATLGQGLSAILVDMHGEATSEKRAMGHFLDGRASLVVGTHSHVPTADGHIMKGGTAYLTDAGMCGDYDSVIGMKKEGSIKRFQTKRPGDRLTPADGEGSLAGIFVETDPKTGLATEVRAFRRGFGVEQASGV
ncbi:MAG: TIGR00282 family metallophosphoesterase [Alphaproteobacteria bacterium]|jgi:metallophosphoesterase (TIGR00282 family)